jgi:hypothetical protein
MTDNVRAFPGQSKPNGEPQIPLINLLENLTERAKSGELQSIAFVGASSHPGKYLPDGTNFFEIIGQLNAMSTMISTHMIEW